jgi:hypothetical protein
MPKTDEALDELLDNEHDCLERTLCHFCGLEIDTENKFVAECAHCRKSLHNALRCMIDLPGVGNMCLHCAGELRPDVAMNDAIIVHGLKPLAALRQISLHAERAAGRLSFFLKGEHDTELVLKTRLFLSNECWLVLKGLKPCFPQPGWPTPAKPQRLQKAA